MKEKKNKEEKMLKIGKRKEVRIMIGLNTIRKDQKTRRRDNLVRKLKVNRIKKVGIKGLKMKREERKRINLMKMMKKLSKKREVEVRRINIIKRKK